MDYVSLDRPLLSDELAQEIGRLHAEFNWLEFVVLDILGQIDGGRLPVEVLAGALQFRQIVETARNAVAWVAVERRDLTIICRRLDDALKRAIEASTFRNELAHSIFGFTKSDTHVIAKRRRDGTTPSTAIDAKTVHERRQQIFDLVEELSALTDEYGRRAREPQEEPT